MNIFQVNHFTMSRKIFQQPSIFDFTDTTSVDKGGLKIPPQANLWHKRYRGVAKTVKILYK